MKRSYVPTKIHFSEKVLKFFNFLEHEVKPLRMQINEDQQALSAVFSKMIELGMLGTRVPEELGGFELDVAQQHYFTCALTRTSGALNLLQTQHQSVQGLMTFASDAAFQLKWLPESCTGTTLFGIGFSHLHQIHQPPVLAEDKGDYFIVNGKVRYATGYGFFNWLALGFVVEKEEFIALIPFEMQNGMTLDYVLPLVAGSSTQTVSFDLKNYKVAKENVLMQKPLGIYRELTLRGRGFPSTHIGTALAVLDLIADAPLMKNEIVQETYQHFLNEIDRFDQAFFAYPEELYIAPIRVQAIMLLQKIFMFADQIFRGGATLKNHPLQLLKHEAQLFSALACEDEMLKASCAFLNQTSF